MSSLLQCPSSIHASDPQHNFLKPFREFQSHSNTEDILLSSMRINDDVFIQFRDGYLSKLSDVHLCMILFEWADIRLHHRSSKEGLV